MTSDLFRWSRSADDMLSVATVVLLSAAPLAAQQGRNDPLPLAHLVEPCDARASVQNLVEPWGQTSRSDPMQSARVALLDLGLNEPRYALAVILRDVMDGSLLSCQIVTLAESGMELVPPVMFTSAERHGRDGFTWRMSTNMRLAGQSDLADAAFSLHVDMASAAVRLEAWSIGPPWVPNMVEADQAGDSE